MRASKVERPAVPRPDAGRDPDEFFSKAFYWLLADGDLTSAEKVLWLALNRWDWQDAAGRPRTWYPSNADIAAATGLSKTQVVTYIDRLIDKGWLVRLDFVGDSKANPTHRVLVRKCPDPCRNPGRPPTGIPAPILDRCR